MNVSDIQKTIIETAWNGGVSFKPTDDWPEIAAKKIMDEIKKELDIEFASGYEAGVSFCASQLIDEAFKPLSQPSDNTLPTCVGSESKGLLVNDKWRCGELQGTGQPCVKDATPRNGKWNNRVCDEHFHCKGELCNERCVIESLSLSGRLAQAHKATATEARVRSALPLGDGGEQTRNITIIKTEEDKHGNKEKNN